MSAEIERLREENAVLKMNLKIQFTCNLRALERYRKVHPEGLRVGENREHLVSYLLDELDRLESK